MCFIYFQAAEKLSWIAHDVSDALSSATGQETVPVEPALLPDTLTSPTRTRACSQASRVREFNPSLVLSSEVFEEEVADIAQVHCESELFEFELTDHPPAVRLKEIFKKNYNFGRALD